MGLVLLVTSGTVNILFAPDRLPERLVGFAMQIAICLGALAASRWRQAARHGRVLAAGLVLAMGSTLFYTLPLSAADLDVLTGPVSCIMIGSTLFFPWGALSQVLVTGAMGLGYATFLGPQLTVSGMRAVNVGISIGLSAVLSVMGALVLERSRRAAFAERERVHALAVQRRRLLDVNRDLWSTLSVDAIAERLVAHAGRIVPADAVTLVLRNAQDGIYAVVAASGDPACQKVVDVPWTAAFSARLCAAFGTAEVRESPGSALDELVLPPLQALGFATQLTAMIGAGPSPLGFVGFLRRSPEPFTRTQRVAAQLLAHQAFGTLSAARLYEQATHANRLKSEFVSTMSHELRTPLHVIMGFTEMLEELDGEQRTGALDKVRGASRELLALIEATLDLNRLESGRDTPHLGPVAVQPLWDELASEFAALPAKPGVELRWEAPGGATLRTDRRKLKTILKNLVSNALKFTSAGEVVATCRMDAAACRFVVRDTGVGIAAEHVPYIFDMFRQVDSSDRRSYAGVGLGLHIVRRLVEQLGGELSVESAPGLGSTFTVLLPRDGAADGRLEAAA